MVVEGTGVDETSWIGVALDVSGTTSGTGEAVVASGMTSGTGEAVSASGMTSGTGEAVDASGMTSGTDVVLGTSGATSGTDVALDVSCVTVVDTSGRAALDSVDWIIGADMGVVWISSTNVVLEPATVPSDGPATVVSEPAGAVESIPGAGVVNSTLIKAAVVPVLIEDEESVICEGVVDPDETVVASLEVTVEANVVLGTSGLDSVVTGFGGAGTVAFSPAI